MSSATTGSDAHDAVWSSDNQSLVHMPFKGDQAAQLVTLDQPTTAVPLAVSPSYTLSSSFWLQQASPDGQYIAMCEHYGSFDGKGEKFERNLIYNVANDQWQVLHEGNDCVPIVGWLSAN